MGSDPWNAYVKFGWGQGRQTPPPWISTQSNVCWNDKKKSHKSPLYNPKPKSYPSIASEQEVCIAENQSEIKFVGFFDELK